jgi:ribonuclease BN (tRNA processing enzyme)
LLHDAQYTSEEYRHKMGWGHCSIEDAIKFASLTDVKHLLLSHHDPSHSDSELNKIFTDFTNRHSFPFKYEMAFEGMKIHLS